MFSSEHWIGARAVIGGRKPVIGGVRRRLVGEIGWNRTLQAGERDELCHRRPKAFAFVSLANVDGGGQRLLPVRHHLRGRGSWATSVRTAPDAGPPARVG